MVPFEKEIYVFLGILALVFIFVGYLVIRNYKNSNYYQVTKNSFFKTITDKGLLGEYMTYRELKLFEEKGSRFLYNIYLPREDGTTEIDVLLITPKGIFVFESKNYSGWILGSEFQKNWYQTLPQGRGKSRKEAFYNPIMQNKTHIKYLKPYINEETPIHSVVVFSERCELKNIKLRSDAVKVIKRNAVLDTVIALYKQTEEIKMTEEQIASLYDTLYPFTQVSTEVKEAHIEQIKQSLKQSEDFKL